MGEVRQHFHGSLLRLCLCEHYLAGYLRVLHSRKRPSRPFRSTGGDNVVLLVLHDRPEPGHAEGRQADWGD